MILMKRVLKMILEGSKWSASGTACVIRPPETPPVAISIFLNWRVNQ